ncbi:transmembrane protein 222 isoform X1 [Tenrec ecaudatus]|uniref:transmembrane protein 222 isoform X1 n=1 Tax=Tenrec ecaudatus TaxID=94439 RepID=UPI003F5979FF
MAEAEGCSPLLSPPPPPPPLPPGMAEVEAPTAAETDLKQLGGSDGGAMDVERSRFPYCVVWTPIPVLTWFFPIIGHMGICTSTGVIRDFAGPYFVSEDNMAFGKPAKEDWGKNTVSAPKERPPGTSAPIPTLAYSGRYWKLDPARVYASGPNAWDTAVHDASEEYKHRMHNLCCDNCHSHVALALNLMRYNSTSWNMVTLCFFCLLYGKYVSVGAFVKTWLPFVLLLGIILTVSLVLHLR